jgi:hypothetical protein
VLTITALEVDADGAVAWAAAHPGWYVLPGRLVQDPESGEWRKVPLVRWSERASKDPDDIRAMWNEPKVGGTAIMCVSCAPSGIWVLDEDTDPGEEWAAILDDIREHKRTLVLRSCTKGRPHYVFKQGAQWVAESGWEGGDVKASGIIFISSEPPIVEAPVAVAPIGLTDRLKKGRPKGRGRGVASSEEMWEWLTTTPDPDDALFHTDEVAGKFIDIIVDHMANSVEAGAHRRLAARDAVFKAAIEATAGCYSAEAAYSAIKVEYRELRQTSSGDKGWTRQRSDDYDLMWASLVPAFREGDYDDAVNEKREQIIKRFDIDESDVDEATRQMDRILRRSSGIEDTDSSSSAPELPELPELPDPPIALTGWEPMPLPATPMEPMSVAKVDHAPTLGEDALWGPHGELIEALRGKTESSDAGLLGAMLAYSGACNAGKAHFMIGVDPHGPNVYVLNIGASSAARKSSALSLVRQIFYGREKEVAVSFLPRQISGVASGERLIHVWTPDRETDDTTGVITDVWPERRVLLEETEASAVWKRARRDGAVLPDVFCRMWDQTVLANHAITSGSVSVPADRHLAGFIGCSTLHVAVEAVTAGDGSDAKSGFGNRFIWLYLPDSGVDLPFGAVLPKGAIRKYQDDLGLYDGTLGRIGETGFGKEVEFSKDAKELWAEVYGVIKRDKGSPGLIEGMCSRGESQVLRLALNYWLAAHGDLKSGVGIDALRAGMAVWRYAKASVEYIFGSTTGDRDVDNLRADLASRGGWASLEELRIDLNRNTLAAVVDKGEALGIMTQGRITTGRKGRPPRAVALTEWLRAGTLTKESYGGKNIRGVPLGDVNWKGSARPAVESESPVNPPANDGAA